MIEYYQQAQFEPFALEHDCDAHDLVGVMFVHGFTGSPADMRPVANLLFELGADCHVILHPGMAGDIANLSKVTALDWRDASLQRWAEHTRRYKSTILVGYSMGGAAAIQMAAQTAPDLLLLIAPFVRINDRRAMFLPVLKHAIKEFKLLSRVNFDLPEVREWFEAALPGLDFDDPETRRVVRDDTGIAAPVLDELRKFGAMGNLDAPKVTSPVVIIQGHQDIVVNPGHTRRLMDRFPYLQAYHEIAGEHLLTLDTVRSWPTVRSLVLREAEVLLPNAQRDDAGAIDDAS